MKLLRHTFLLFLLLCLFTCLKSRREYNFVGNWILKVENDSTYTEVVIDSNYFDIYYNHYCVLRDRRNYRISKDTFLFSRPNKPDIYSKCIIDSYNENEIHIKNITYHQSIKFYRIKDSEFTVNKVISKKDIYNYEIASKNRMFRFLDIDSVIIPNYENYMKSIETITLDDDFEEEIEIINLQNK